MLVIADRAELDLDLLEIAEAPGPDVHERQASRAADARELREDLGDEAPFLIISQ